MTTPAVYGGLGIKSNGLGQIGLGGSQPVQSFAMPAMSQTALSYILHLYDHNLAFKRTLGGATLLTHPGLKMTQNGGYQPITLEVSSLVEGGSTIYGIAKFGNSTYQGGGAGVINIGDVGRLSEQGDTGTIVFSGNIESTPVEMSPSGTHFQIALTPWVSELGDGYFNKTYATPTDVAQFVRDAVATTAHCSVSPLSCPDSGIKATYDFVSSNPLDAIHIAKQIAGSNWWWHCDAQGIVWFQPIVISNPPTLTLLKGTSYNSRKSSSSISGMRNKVVVFGGGNPGDPGRIQAVYDNTTSQQAWGVRAFNPTLSYPTVTDQTVLNAIATSIGAQFDRVQTTVELNCPTLGTRLQIGRPGGLTVRFWEPNVSPLPQAIAGLGTYSPTFIVQDIETSGPQQKLIVGDSPYSDIDTTYEATRIAQRTSVVAATAVPTPALAPPSLTAPTTQIVANLSTITGVQSMGGGIVNIGTFGFTTVKAGTCQILGAIDARMEAWDNQIGVPRRAVRAILSGGIFTGAWQELPFGLTRATYDLSSAPGISLPAGFYTLNVQIDTQEFNQMHIYSGWAQVVAII